MGIFVQVDFKVTLKKFSWRQSETQDTSTVAPSLLKYSSGGTRDVHGVTAIGKITFHFEPSSLAKSRMLTETPTSYARREYV